MSPPCEANPQQFDAGHGSKDSEPTEDSIAQQSLSLNLAPPRKRAQRETVASPSHLEPFLISDDSEDWVASTESDSDDEEDNDLIQVTAEHQF